MRKFKIRFKGTSFTANEDALINIINLASSKDEFLIISLQDGPKTTSWERNEENAPLAEVYKRRIVLVPREDNNQKSIWNDIADEFREWNRAWNACHDHLMTSQPLERKSDFLKRLQETYEIKKR